jgi:mannose-6-phosphate isomerase-like protein (cupin superfamily)
LPPDTGPPPHLHHAEDETFVPLEGELTFRVGDQEHASTAGTTVFVPRGTRHSFTNVGRGVARMLFMYSPAGMEGTFAEIVLPALAASRRHHGRWPTSRP